MSSNLLWPPLVLAALLNAATPAHALDDSTKSVARTLVADGVTAYKASRYEEARQKFLEAYELAKVPTVAVWAGQAHEKLGKWVAAAEFYEHALLMQPNELWVGSAQQQAMSEAAERLAALKPRIPTVKIAITGSNVTQVALTIDGTEIPHAAVTIERPLDPGVHQLLLSRGGRSNSQAVELAAGEKKVVTLAAPESEVTTPTSLSTQHVANPGSHSDGHVDRPRRGQTQRSVGWVAIGVGTAGLVAGVTTGIVVAVKRSSLHDDGCAGNVCRSVDLASRVDSYNAWRTISMAAFAVGAVGLGAGVTLLLTSPHESTSAAVGVMFGPGGIGLQGVY